MRTWTMVEEGRVGVHVPYRSSPLTRVLKESFTRRDTLMAVVGTLSPASTDTEHSISTLKTITAIAASHGSMRESKEDVKPATVAPAPDPPPKAWDAARTRRWLAQASQGAFAPLLGAIPPNLDGKALMRMPAKQMRSLWGASEGQACALFGELRAKTKRAAAAADKHRREARGAEVGRFD